MFFEIKKHKKPKNDENEKDARRKMIGIRLINSSSTSVSNSNMKNTGLQNLWISVDYQWTFHRYLWIIHELLIDIHNLLSILFSGRGV